jgi:hypothetical protein
MDLAWEEEDDTEDLNLDSNIILKLILKEWDARSRRELCDSEYGSLQPTVEK